MRILFFADAIFDDIAGGSRVAARQLAQQLAGLGHEVTFLVGRHSSESPDDEMRPGYGRVVRYAGAGRGRAFIANGYAACARLWAEEPFDVVHTHFAYAAVGPLAAVPAAVPRVRTFHGPWDEEGWVADTQRGAGLSLVKARVKKMLRYRVEKQNLRRSARVLTLSASFRRLVTERYGVPAENVESIPGGTDLNRFRPAENKYAVRQELGLPHDRTLLLSIRRLAPRMGLDHLVAAMPAVVRRHPDVLLLLGGIGPEKAALERSIREKGLEGHVRLLGFVSEGRLAVHYQAADLFVLPTLALEGFGLVTTEALACGVPVLGTNVGATPEILSGLDPRLIIPGTTYELIAAAILDYLEGDWKAELTPARLHEYVCRRYTWERHARATVAIYQAVTRR